MRNHLSQIEDEDDDFQGSPAGGVTPQNEYSTKIENNTFGESIEYRARIDQGSLTVEQTEESESAENEKKKL